MSRRMKMIGVIALVVDLTLMMSGCIEGVVNLGDDLNHSGNVEATATFSRFLELEGQTGIRIVGANGTVQIWGVVGGNEVVVDAVRRVRSDSHRDAAEHLADLHVVVQTHPHEFVVKTDQPSQSHGRTYIVDYEITVPAHLLPNVTNGNGSVRLEGVSADVSVTNGNGDVVLWDVVGSSWVAVGNGEIRAQTYLPQGGQIIHSVGNGSIALSIQAQVSASFGAKVGNGTISLTGLNLQQVISTPRQLQGMLGGGGGLIDLSLGNGQIKVEGG